MKYILILVIAFSTLLSDQRIYYPSYFGYLSSVEASFDEGHFESCNYKVGGLEGGVYFIYNHKKKNFYDGHDMLHMKVTREFEKGSFQSGGLMNGELSYGVHFVDANNKHPDMYHKQFHKNVAESFKKGSFESFGNAYCNSGVHFVESKK